MSSFQPKTGRVNPRKNKKKIYRCDQFVPDPEQRIKTKQLENSKNQKTSL